MYFMPHSVYSLLALRASGVAKPWDPLPDLLATSPGACVTLKSRQTQPSLNPSALRYSIELYVEVSLFCRNAELLIL
jgi:hypothetical protein